MVEFRPHTLRYLISNGGYKDPLNRDWVEGKEVWSDPIPCRYEPNGKANTYILDDGRAYVYQYVVYLDLDSIDIPYGSKIRIYDQAGTKITEKNISGFHRGQLNVKIWV